MNTQTKVLIINGSYRDDGITDQAVAVAIETLKGAGAEVEVVNLREYPIEFCLNCRECTQQPGETPGQCVLHDGMPLLVDKIERAQAYILAAPTNFGSVTAIFKRFMERLVVYAYWPWSQPYPAYRKAGARPKKALLISSSASPGILGRWLFGSSRQLKMAAKVIGAKPVGSLFTGLISREKQMRLPAKAAARTRLMARRLIAA